MITIIGEKYQCRKCGRYYYINKGAGELMGANCPFCWNRTEGKYLRDVRIIL